MRIEHRLYSIADIESRENRTLESSSRHWFRRARQLLYQLWYLELHCFRVVHRRRACRRSSFGRVFLQRGLLRRDRLRLPVWWRVVAGELAGLIRCFRHWCLLNVCQLCLCFRLRRGCLFLVLLCISLFLSAPLDNIRIGILFLS